MSDRELVPCERCARHVRTTEPCPFCGAPPTVAVPRLRTARGLTRAAIFAGGLSTLGCPFAGYGGPPDEIPPLVLPAEQGPSALAATWFVEFLPEGAVVDSTIREQLASIVREVLSTHRSARLRVSAPRDPADPTLHSRRAQAVADELEELGMPRDFVEWIEPERCTDCQRTTPGSVEIGLYVYTDEEEEAAPPEPR